MANEDRTGYSARRMLWVVVAALVVVAVVLWAMGAFHRQGLPPNMRETYTTDTKDLSGGKLIVPDESAPKVPVNLPVTRMTNVPPDQVPSPTPNTAPSPSPGASPAK